MSRHGGAISAYEALYTLLDWIIRLAGAGIVLITGYYLYGTIAHSGELFRGAAQSGPVSAAVFRAQLNNMQFLTQILLVCSVVGMLATVGRFYANVEGGIVLAVLGLALLLGMPLVIDVAGGPAAGLPPSLLKFGNPRATLRGEFITSGAVLTFGGIGQLLVHLILWLSRAGTRRPQPRGESAQTAEQVRKLEDRFLGLCWQLPFCRDTDKQLCPVRKTKKPCWRTGRGCYCDQNIVLQLSGGSAYMARATGAMSQATVVRPKTWSEKRAQCLECPIYLHHQGQKYKVVAPLALAGVGFAVFALWGTIFSAYPKAIIALGKATAGFSFGTARGQAPAWANELATQPALVWLAAIIIGILVVAYLFHALEWLLYRLGI